MWKLVDPMTEPNRDKQHDSDERTVGFLSFFSRDADQSAAQLFGGLYELKTLFVNCILCFPSQSRALRDRRFVNRLTARCHPLDSAVCDGVCDRGSPGQGGTLVAFVQDAADFVYVARGLITGPSAADGIEQVCDFAAVFDQNLLIHALE